MSAWKDFLDSIFGDEDKPGKVMICFVNRYLEGMDDVRYKIKYDGIEKSGTTTAENYCVELSPKSLDPIQTFVWSRKAMAYKKLDDVTPVKGRKKLVRKVMKTFKVPAKTEQLPKTQPKPRPTKPAAAPAPAPSPTAPQGVQPQQTKNESNQPQTKVQRAVPGDITVDQMKKIWPTKSQDVQARIKSVIDELNKDLSGYKLDTPLRRAHFFAQVREEAGSTFRFIESLDYSAERLIRTKAQATKDKPAGPFSYFKKPEHHPEAFLYGRTSAHPANEEAIANRAYALKIGNGNIASGDGWRYRGRGLKQLTGRGNYRDFTEAYPLVWSTTIDFEKDPDLLSQPLYAVRSAVWFWLHYKLYEFADKGPDKKYIDSITERINKNTDSYVNRQRHFEQRAWPAFR